MASSNTSAGQETGLRQEGEVSGVSASALRPPHRHRHRHTDNPHQARSRSRERIIYITPENETSARRVAGRPVNRERTRDSSREYVRVPEELRERINLGGLERSLQLERQHLQMERDRLQIERDRLTRRFQGSQDNSTQVIIRPYESEGERDRDRPRRIIVSERQPEEWLRRSDGDLTRYRRIRIDDRNEPRISLRERPSSWSAQQLRYHTSPSPPLPRPPAPPPSPSSSMPMSLDSRIPYLSHLSDDPVSSAYGDRPAGRPTTVRVSDSGRPPIYGGPLFPTPYYTDDTYYVRIPGRNRDRQSDRRSEGSVVLSERNYRNERSSPEPRYYHTSPSLARPDYTPSMTPLPPPPTPITRVATSSTTRASSPAIPVTTPAFVAVEPTTADEPTEDVKNREKLLDFMFSHAPDLVHQNLVRDRARDSGTWLFTLPVFEKWRKSNIVDDGDAIEGGRNNCIWLSGNLGAGKTMLMSAIIDHLVGSVETLSEIKRKKTAILYYYFDRSLPSSPRDAIASLLRQLCSQKDVGPLPRFLADNLAAMESSSSNGGISDTVTHNAGEALDTPIPIGDIVADFLSLQLRFDSVYICLDGLEECDDLVALFELLVRLVASSPSSRLAISARPQIVQPGIIANIGSKDMVVILEQHNAPDIRSYLETYTKKYGCLADMIGPETLPEHIKMLTERSGGNFLAVTTEIAELNRLTTKFDINQHINSSSFGFLELFSQIWSRLNDQPPLRAILAKRIFYWLSVSRRTLTLTELQQAITIEPENYHDPQALDQGEKLSPPSLIEEVCMGFVRVDSASNNIFTHPSALPFYFYMFNMPFAAEAREYAAKCCVGFLNSEILSHGVFKSQEAYDQMDRKLPFSRYVSQHWGTHLNDFKEGYMQEITEKLLGNVSLMDTMNQLLHVNRPAAGKRRRYDDYPSEFNGRHFGAYFRLETASKMWTSREDWEAVRDSWGRKPLHVASSSPSLYYRHVIFDACKDDTFSFVISATDPSKKDTSPDLSIENKPPVTDKGDSNTKEAIKGFRCEPVSALPWAWGWIGNATEPLNTQVPFTREEMNILDNQGKTPLHHFIVAWSEDRFRYILDTLFDLQHPSEEGKDMVSDSNTDKAELLPTLADHNGRTILDYACQRNVVYVALVFTASSWSAENISSAIVFAATGGHLWPLKQLLELVAEFKTETLNLDFKDAVIQASKRGFTDIVRLLRQQGANLSKPEQDKQGMTALHYAAYGSHLETVRYLLLEGADPNYLDELGRSPLFCASDSGNKGIVSLLIEKGASPNAVNSEGFSSLQLAARNGNSEVVKKLLRFVSGERSAAKSGSRHSDTESKSPLHLAAEYGHNNVVQLLLDDGLPCDSKDDSGRTPLSYACQIGIVPTVKLLLTRKVDVNTQDAAGRTPLSYAAAGGHVDVVVALMGQSDLDPNIMDSEERSPLIFAAQNGHGDVVMLLAVMGAKAGCRATILRTSGGVLSKLTNPPGCHKLVNIEHPDSQGHTARYYLRQAKNYDAIKFLDTVSAHETRGELQQPGDDQGHGADTVATNTGKDDFLNAKRGTQVDETIPTTEKESTQNVDPGNLGPVVVVDKTTLTPLAEESEDTMAEDNMGKTGPG